VTEQLGVCGETRVVELVGGHLDGIGLALVAGQLVDQCGHAVGIARRDRSDRERSGSSDIPSNVGSTGGDCVVRGDADIRRLADRRLGLEWASLGHEDKRDGSEGQATAPLTFRQF